MDNQLTVYNERIDDIPILLTQTDRMGLGHLLDQHFPTHGNWQGLSLGTVSQVWLAYILSEGDHRMSPVQQWAEEHEVLLEMSLGTSVRALDFSDDRLASVLDSLGSDRQWEAFESDLNRQILRVYDLRPKQIRIDSSTAKRFVKVTPDGLFQFGHSKDGRPDLPQIKVNMSSLDPLGLPVTTTLVSGEKADDPLYVPEVRKVQATLGYSGVTYIGDAKMASMATRAIIAGSDDFYLCPLPSVQVPASELEKILAPVWDGTQSLFTVNRPLENPESKPEKMAEGFSFEVLQTAEVDGQSISWLEMRFVVLSFKYADRQTEALRKRLMKAVKKIEKLNERCRGKKKFTNEAELKAVVDEILKKYRVEGMLNLTYKTQREERTKRRYLNRPAQLEVVTSATVLAQVDEDAVAHAIRKMGWRVFVTNQENLTLEQTVLAYRGQYLIERGFRRLKDKQLSLTPMYLDSETRIKGLIRLLIIALRMLILVEYHAREGLRQAGEKLSGIYPGNPKRSTASPTAEMMLRVFRGVTMTCFSDGETDRISVTPLSTVQQRILQLLGMPSWIYTDLGWHSSEPISKMSEP